MLADADVVVAAPAPEPSVNQADISMQSVDLLKGLWRRSPASVQTSASSIGYSAPIAVAATSLKRHTDRADT